MKIIIASMLLLFSLCTYSQTKQREKDVMKEMVESSIKQDTLSIVSTADYLFYPFHKTTKPTLYFPDINFEIQENNGIYQLNYKNSFLRLLLNPYCSSTAVISLMFS